MVKMEGREGREGKEDLACEVHCSTNIISHFVKLETLFKSIFQHKQPKQSESQIILTPCIPSAFTVKTAFNNKQSEYNKKIMHEAAAG
jgi:hypothetical protein